MPTRRRALQTAAGAAVAFPILGQQHQHSSSTNTSTTYRPKWATAAEMAQLAEIADVILPRTDTPGASDARVQEYIDFQLAKDKVRQKVLRDGMRWMASQKDKAAALGEASRKPDSVEGRFFRLMKDLTIDGYYQSKEGLVTELGWHGNTYLAKWDGCTHPEHKG